MNPIHRLHSLRMENDATRFAMDEMRPRFERIAARHENGTAPRAVSAFNLFQTPPALAARLVSLLNLKPGDRVLEPSAGLGRLIREIEPHCPIVAVEVAPQIAAELFATFQSGVTLKQRDFLTCTRVDLGAFDAVVMNPPFHMRADIRHILHARTFLKPGGRLAALCMDTPIGSARPYAGKISHLLHLPKRGSRPANGCELSQADGSWTRRKTSPIRETQKGESAERRLQRPGPMSAPIATETRWPGSLQGLVGHPSHFQRLPSLKNKCRNRSIPVDTLAISGYGVGVMSEAQ